METTREAGGTAILVLVLTLAAGAGAGFGVGATRSSTGSFFETAWASMVEQPLGGADKTFNWLLFCLFAAAGIVASAAVWAGITISNAIATHRPTVTVQQPAAGSTSGHLPPLPPMGRSFGVKPSSELNPPQL